MPRARRTKAGGKLVTRREQLESVLKAVAEGQSVRSACREVGIDLSSAVTSLYADDELAKQYARARQCGADVLAGDAIDVAKLAALGKMDPNGARLLVDTIKWTAARMHPRGWGDGTQRQAPETEAPPTNHAIIDVPKQETMEEFTERRRRELVALRRPGGDEK